LSHKYQDLIVWQRAKAFASEVDRVTEGFPKIEIHGLTSQLRRAAVSVASNIAEGQGRLTRGEFCHFFGQAGGSLLDWKLSWQLPLIGTLLRPSSKSWKRKSSEVRR
jgi:four helix bundle protein